MSLQDFAQTAFESGHLHVTPVTNRRIETFSDLPVVSYEFETGGDEKTVMRVFYDVNVAEGAHGRHYGSNTSRSVARKMVESLSLFGVTSVTDHRYYESMEDFLGLTLHNLLMIKRRYDIENPMFTRGAVIHSGGDTIIPLPQGARFIIHGENEDNTVNDWSVIVTGTVLYFGQERQFHISHAHCEGFTLPADVFTLMNEAHAIALKWFPFFQGNLFNARAEYVNNPVKYNRGYNRG